MGKEYLATDVCRITGVERRTIQTWVDGGFISPSLEKADGPGTRNRWNEDDLVAIKMFAHLLTKGFSREAAARIVGPEQRMFTVDVHEGVTENSSRRDLSFFFSYTLGFPTFAACAASKSKSVSFIVCTALPIAKAVATVMEFMKLEEVESLIIERVDGLIEEVNLAL